jgi:DNA-binding HxlR family transcriptional regulator
MATSSTNVEPNLPASILRKDCPSQGVLDMVASKWSVLILYALRHGKLRYSELQHTVEGISQKMLTQTLRELERSGLVKRIVYPVVPPHTEYELTELGHSLEGVVYQLGGWAHEYMEAVLQARQLYDGAHG